MSASQSDGSDARLWSGKPTDGMRASVLASSPHGAGAVGVLGSARPEETDMNRFWLTAAAAALLPLAAEAEVRAPKGWEARGDRLAHAASGFSCARTVAGFELTG